MPFTPCHAAAVLPLLRTPLPASALVAGAVAPDLPYYWPVPVPVDTHTAAAIVSTDLLLAAAAWALWHAVLAAPALAAAPAGLRARLTGVPLGLRPRVGTAARVAETLLALVAGAATHVLWDEFTHDRGWGAANIPALAAGYGPLPGWAWLQHLSTVVGALLLGGWFLRWWRRTPPRSPQRRPATWWAWALLLGAGLLAGVPAALGSAGPGGPGLGMAMFEGATRGGWAVALTALVLAAVWRARHRTGRP